MLNYRHSESSSRHVRVVHQLPSAVVECLASEKSIDLVPLHPVETTPRDEDTDVFRAALREAADPEWLAAEDAKRAAGSRRRSKDKAAERSLRDHEALTELLSYRPTPRQALNNSDIGGRSCI
jgi:hypothetical protein